MTSMPHYDIDLSVSNDLEVIKGVFPRVPTLCHRVTYMTYRDASSLSRHAGATREAILEAAFELLSERGGADFSVQEVADRAGVTHRTVYRYFPGRHILLDSAAGRIPGFVDPTSFDDPDSVQAWIDALPDRLANFEAHLDIARAVVSAVFASDEMSQTDAKMHPRYFPFWEVFRREFPSLTEDEALQSFAVLRQMGSSMTYITFRRNLGLSPSAATEAIQTAARWIVDATASRELAAAD
jgi:AcrR family transcriptional regulator